MKAILVVGIGIGLDGQIFAYLEVVVDVDVIVVV
jgi:hypothetical protein